MSEQRPMTEAEERLVDLGLEYMRTHDNGNGNGTLLRAKLAELREAALFVHLERNPKPITPEERAVVEAAKRLAARFEVTGETELGPVTRALLDAVRRLP